MAAVVPQLASGTATATDTMILDIIKSKISIRNGSIYIYNYTAMYNYIVLQTSSIFIIIEFISIM